jgi:hypothetical protein
MHCSVRAWVLFRVCYWGDVMKLAICRGAKVMKSKSKQPRLVRTVDRASYVEVSSPYQFAFSKGDLVSIGGDVFTVLRGSCE